MNKNNRIMNDHQYKNIVIQLTDYLFEQGHTINKPLVTDAAAFVKMYAESWYLQGKMSKNIEPPKLEENK